MCHVDVSHKSGRSSSKAYRLELPMALSTWWQHQQRPQNWYNLDSTMILNLNTLVPSTFEIMVLERHLSSRPLLRDRHFCLVPRLTEFCKTLISLTPHATFMSALTHFTSKAIQMLCFPRRQILMPSAWVSQGHFTLYCYWQHSHLSEFGFQYPEMEASCPQQVFHQGKIKVAHISIETFVSLTEILFLESKPIVAERGMTRLLEDIIFMNNTE